MFEYFSSVWFNLICFIIHGIFGLWLLIDGFAEITVGGFSTKMDLHYVRLNGTSWPQTQYYVQTYGSVNVVLLLSLFSLITSCVHAWYTYSMYVNQSDPPSYKYRYFEYAITAPIMIFIICVLFGVREVFTLVCIFFLMTTTMLFGVLQSWSNESYWPHVFGWCPYTAAWAIILAYFTVLVLDNDVPNFVWIVLFIELGMFTSFGFVQMYYEVLPKAFVMYNYDRDATLKSADGANNLLSLLSKVLLVCILYFNFISLENMDDN